jgi:hypothetical protein
LARKSITRDRRPWKVVLSIAKTELTPDEWDRSDPGDLVRLRYEHEFLNAIANGPDTRFADALAGEPWETLQGLILAVGLDEALRSNEVEEALHRCAQSHGLDLPFVIAYARRTMKRWARPPSEFVRRRLAPFGLERADWPHTRTRGTYCPTPKKRSRGRDKNTGDGARGRYVAFRFLALQHVFLRGNAEIGREFAVDPSVVYRHIRWAAGQLGIDARKPKRGAPFGNTNKLGRKNH